METMMALLSFTGVPAINFCHSWHHWQEGPVLFPRVLRYVAVDEACRERLVEKHRVPDELVQILPNFVDLKRFRRRANPLPARPSRALIFSNYASETNYVRVIRDACANSSISLDVVGSASESSITNPENILGDYDIVFAKARCALEAMAVGVAVVLCDSSGLGPMVNSQNFHDLRRLNFGFRTLTNPIEQTRVVAEISRYDAQQAANVTDMVRMLVDSEAVVDQLLELYAEVIAENRNGTPDFDKESKAVAAYLRELKVELSAHGAASMRLRDKLNRIPLFGGLGTKVARMLVGDAGGRT
jgi:glycosyltransferase involved in cell wall biosynthesis